MRVSVSPTKLPTVVILTCRQSECQTSVSKQQCWSVVVRVMKHLFSLGTLLLGSLFPVQVSVTRSDAVIVFSQFK